MHYTVFGLMQTHTPKMQEIAFQGPYSGGACPQTSPKMAHAFYAGYATVSIPSSLYQCYKILFPPQNASSKDLNHSFTPIKYTPPPNYFTSPPSPQPINNEP
jgi:hypothetical protein